MLSKQKRSKRRGVFKTVPSSAQCMEKDKGKGSDMQGTPPRDLRVFRNLIASVEAVIDMSTVLERVWILENALVPEKDVTHMHINLCKRLN